MKATLKATLYHDTLVGNADMNLGIHCFVCKFAAWLLVVSERNVKTLLEQDWSIGWELFDCEHFIL